MMRIEEMFVGVLTVKGVPMLSAATTLSVREFTGDYFVPHVTGMHKDYLSNPSKH